MLRISAFLNRRFVLAMDANEMSDFIPGDLLGNRAGLNDPKNSGDGKPEGARAILNACTKSLRKRGLIANTRGTRNKSKL